jgi:hypothetical protein
MYDNSNVYLMRKRKIFLSILENKDYFYDINKYRVQKKHNIEYKNTYYNQS